MGKCPECSAWDSLEEFVPTAAGGSEARDPQRGLAEAWVMEGQAPAASPQATRLDDIEPLDIPRLATGINEFDRVLGGGLVPGSTVLIGGEPGIGKSTLMLQAAARLAGAGRPILYVTSEESAQQIQMRAGRIRDHSRDAGSTREFSRGPEAKAPTQGSRGPEANAPGDRRCSRTLLMLWACEVCRGRLPSARFWGDTRFFGGGKGLFSNGADSRLMGEGKPCLLCNYRSIFGQFRCFLESFEPWRVVIHTYG